MRDLLRAAVPAQERPLLVRLICLDYRLRLRRQRSSPFISASSRLRGLRPQRLEGEIYAVDPGRLLHDEHCFVLPAVHSEPVRTLEEQEVAQDEKQQRWAHPHREHYPPVFRASSLSSGFRPLATTRRQVRLIIIQTR